ncbi:MAG: ABC transporter ATP-binding protein [Sporichthyaceae bacterium]
MVQSSSATAWSAYRSYTREPGTRRANLPPGTFRRILGYGRPYKRAVLAFLVLVVLDAALVVASPLLFKQIIDAGVIPGDRSVVTILALVVAGLAFVEAAFTLVMRWYSARIGEGLIYDLRVQVFTHVQRMPIAFFTRTQTGALISRLNNDVIGAQQAFTSTLSGVVSNTVSLVLVGAAMFYLSWQVTVLALVMLPVFLVPAKYVGRRLAALTREQMELNATMSTTMAERFNVSGALLVKLFGRPDDERARFDVAAAGVRGIGVRIAMANRVFFTAMLLVAALATAVVYGVGGQLAISGDMSVGTLLALAALLSRLYGPLTALANVRIDVMTALVSFDRVFELLDLPPAIADAPDAQSLPSGPVAVEFDAVDFRYPGANEVALASLASVAAAEVGESVQVLHGVSFRAEPGALLALVGPSGAGKTTISHLIARLYDVGSGSVRVGGVDVRELTAASLHDAVGVVTQDAHLFHETIRANLAYAKPDATDAEMLAACRDAQIAELIASLPAGLDTVVGDRGYRLSGGEKQRIALARLLLKAPGVVVLDEATAHLDSESEAAVQRALAHTLLGRTAVVIAHRLSTVRAADEILVLDGGRIVERGRHEDLLLRGGLYAELYRTQFAGSPQ